MNKNYNESSGNHTTGSWCDSLVEQAHPSESSSYSHLVDTWAGLYSATSTASFVQNLSVLRLFYSPFQLTHISCNDHTANYSCGHIEQAILNFLLLKLCNHDESLNNCYIIESVKVIITMMESNSL